MGSLRTGGRTDGHVGHFIRLSGDDINIPALHLFSQLYWTWTANTYSPNKHRCRIGWTSFRSNFHFFVKIGVSRCFPNIYVESDAGTVPWILLTFIHTFYLAQNCFYTKYVEGHCISGWVIKRETNFQRYENIPFVNTIQSYAYNTILAIFDQKAQNNRKFKRRHL